MASITFDLFHPQSPRAEIAPPSSAQLPIDFARSAGKICIMKRKAQHPPKPGKEGLVIRRGKSSPLSPTQVEFNRLMKSLETTRASHSREQTRLDEVLDTSIRELMPLVEGINRVNRELVLKGRKVLKTGKFTAKRRHWFGDLLSGRAGDLLADPVGLSAEEIGELEAVVEELGPGDDEPETKGSAAAEFAHLRTVMEEAARHAGLELDLSDLDPNGDPEELERVAQERLRAAFAAHEAHEAKTAAPDATAKPHRKLSKAQAAKERKRLAHEEAKNRDLKSLFKQLAKAFHPDLEPDPRLKKHREVWMQRLNTAYAADDLREMLQLEMEWLGEEATNLANASDEKLKVYCGVLKEQIVGLKRQTHFLPDEPQYRPLHRFRHPRYGTIANPDSIKWELREEMRHHRQALNILAANNADSRRLIHEWADEHARRANSPF